MDQAQPTSDRAARRRTTAPPPSVWPRAALLFAAAWALVIGYFVAVSTPLTSDADREHFAARLEELQLRAEALRAAGKDSLKFVFIGNSRAKNVAFDEAQLAHTAREAGIRRPVVRAYLTINLGGFERLQQAVGLVERARPDYVVIMPELLYEDFSAVFRATVGFRFLQQMLRFGEFALFDAEEEFGGPACLGFDDPPEQRLSRRQYWMHASPDARGPRAAAAAMRHWADSGIQIYVAEIPTHPRLAELRGDAVDYRALLARHGFDGRATVRLLAGGGRIPADAYCDYAHISPEKADLWLRPLFAAIAGDELPLPDPSRPQAVSLSSQSR